MKHYCVISHTHWDREWYLTQEQFRLKLVDMMDNLLVLLEKEPEYVFHLDAQTIVLEDYWDIKPEKKALCCKMIREGRLIVGPWYVQNDFLLTSGEATVRNLLLGRKQAQEAGACGDTGYTPDQFGLISQLPQILRGFGIDNCIFGRGYRDYTVNDKGEVQENPLPAELIWRSPDGSEVFAVCMSFWYNNAQRFSADPDRAMHLVRWQNEHFSSFAKTPYLLLMNGVDHLEAQDDLLAVLTELQNNLPEDEKIYQTTFHRYLELVQQYLSGQKLPVWEGEMVTGLDPQILKDCGSTRVYIKQKNAYLQNMLENRLEPLYALLEMSGMEGCYPVGHLDFQWKMLIRNHAHDSICGCSNDAVMRHVQDRMAAIEEAVIDLQKRGLELLSSHVDRTTLQESDYLIAVCNTTEQQRTACVEVDVDILHSDMPTGLTLWSAAGEKIPYTLLAHQQVNRRMISALNLPGFREVDRYRIRLLAEDIPAFGYQVYRVETRGEPEVKERKHSPVMENRYLRVNVSDDGRIDLLHKATGHWYRDVLVLEDRADAGHSYISIPLAGDRHRLLRDIPALEWNTEDPLRQSVKLHYRWELPAYLDAGKHQRSQESVCCPVTVILTLDRESQWLDVKVEMVNTAKDHRLLALVRTGLVSDETISLSPYDLVRHNKQQLHTAICNETRHTSGLVSIASGNLGMSVLNKGLYSYENLQRENGTISLTLVRATGRVWPPDSTGFPEDDSWEAPENQCLRPLEMEFALYPHGVLQDADVLYAVKSYQTPMLVHSGPVDTRKFLGGRPALQDANIDENFYPPDPFPNIVLPLKSCPWKLHGDNLQVTAWKKCFDRSDYVLRFFNGNEHPQTVQLEICDLPVRAIWKSDLQEECREALTIFEDCVNLEVRGKEIVTLIVDWQAQEIA